MEPIRRRRAFIRLARPIDRVVAERAAATIRRGRVIKTVLMAVRRSCAGAKPSILVLGAGIAPDAADGIARGQVDVRLCGL